MTDLEHSEPCNGTRTLLELVQHAWSTSGRAGPMTSTFIAEWLELNPTYHAAAKFSLSTRFRSGSATPIRGSTRLERATAKWIAAGNPAPGAPNFDRAAFDAFMQNYIDEYSIFYHPE